MLATQSCLLDLPHYLASISEAEELVLVIFEESKSYFVENLPALLKEEVEIYMREFYRNEIHEHRNDPIS